MVGGIVGYPSEQLYEEVACIASEFHWSLEEIIVLEHGDRRRWVGEIGKLRQAIDDMRD
ncbi:MAG: DUF6760 family protein [Cyanobacteria bacterium P01_A01_bin.68]